MHSSTVYRYATDSILSLWIADGDRRAFEEILARHGPLALRVACHLLCDPRTAEEVAQEALVRAWAQAKDFDRRQERFLTWLCRIVVAACMDHHLRTAAERVAVNAANERTEGDDRLLVTVRALHELTIRQRAALALAREQGMSGAEVGQVLGVSTQAVDRLLARARAYVRERITTCDGK